MGWLKKALKRLRFGPVLLGLALTAGVVVLAPQSASAAPLENATDLSTTPDRIWDVDVRSGLARHTGTYQTLIWDLQELNGVMYAGGDFTQVVAPDGSRTARSFLVAFDLETGAWIPSFNPQLDSLVYTLDVTDDGKLIAGGEFTGGVAVLDPVTGAAVPGFSSDLQHSWGPPAVFTVETNGSDIYVGGRFVRGTDALGNRVDVQNLAKVDVATGAVDPTWTPSVQPVFYNGSMSQRIQDIEVDPIRNRVYVGGLFASINGDATSGSFAVLDPDTGASLFGRPVVDNPIIFVYDIALEGNLVHYGGKENYTITVDADTFVRQTDLLYTTNGDHQVIVPGANTLWVGCHCWRQAFTGLPGQNPFAPPADAVTVNAIIGINRVTGEVEPVTFDLRGAAGAWDIIEDVNGRLWVGGQFTQGGGRSLYGLARFSPVVDPDAVLTACTAERDGTQVVVTWEGDAQLAASDRFIVRRSVDGSPFYWRGRTNGDVATFTDSDRSGALVYTVEAQVGSDVFGPVECTEAVVETPAPTGLRATRITKERVVLNWVANGEVEIARDGVVIATDADGWFTDLTVESGTTYEYRVRYTGSGTWSDPITVTTN